MQGTKNLYSTFNKGGAKKRRTGLKVRIKAKGDRWYKHIKRPINKGRFNL